MEHPDRQSRNLDLDELRRRGADAVTHRFSEADIAQLEAEDLTDPWIIVMLNLAYRQNDPKEATIHAIRREPDSSGSKAELERAVADAEAELERQPNDYYARYKRLCARGGLARLAGKGAERTPSDVADLVKAIANNGKYAPVHAGVQQASRP